MRCLHVPSFGPVDYCAFKFVIRSSKDAGIEGYCVSAAAEDAKDSRFRMFPDLKQLTFDVKERQFFIVIGDNVCKRLIGCLATMPCVGNQVYLLFSIQPRLDLFEKLLELFDVEVFMDLYLF